MHELKLAEDVLNKIKEEARNKGIKKITQVKVRIGETLVSDLPELKEIFSTLSIGSIAEESELEIKVSPLKGRCASCKNEINSRIPRLDCSNCGSTNVQIFSGRELVIEDLK